MQVDEKFREGGCEWLVRDVLLTGTENDLLRWDDELGTFGRLD